MGLLILLILLAFIIGVGYFAYWYLSKRDISFGPSDDKNERMALGLSEVSGGEELSAQEFLPYHTIKEDVIFLGNHQYRAIMQVSSINYGLLNEQEQNLIEMSFQGLLNGLSHPITLFISTRQMDFAQLLTGLYNDYQKTLKEFPGMREYLQENLYDMQNLSSNLGDNRYKEKYIIVPLDGSEYSHLSPEEEFEIVKEQLENRIENLQSQLARIPLKSRRLDEIDIMNLVIQTFHRDGSKFAEHLMSGELTSALVVGDDKLVDETMFNEEEHFDILLKEYQNELNDKFINNPTISNEMKRKADRIWRNIHQLRTVAVNGIKEDNRPESLSKIKNYGRQEYTGASLGGMGQLDTDIRNRGNQRNAQVIKPQPNHNRGRRRKPNLP